MNRVVATSLLTFAAVCAFGRPVPAQKPQPDAKTQRIDACSLLTTTQIKEHLPWEPMFDQFAVERDDIGVTGSACSYPTVIIQVLTYSASFVDAARKQAMAKQGRPEPVSGVGADAFVYHNPAGYVELIARVGPRLLTLQANIGRNETFESVKPKTIALATALAAKLP